MAPLVVTGIVAGLARVARARLLAGRADELPGLARELSEWALSLSCPRRAMLDVLGGAAPIHGLGPRLRATDPREPSDERARILHATALLAAQEGYWQLRIPRIRAQASVSRASFDEHFESLQSCFVCALERLAADALADVVREGATGHSWSGGVHRALAALCARIAADSDFANLGFVEVFAPGPSGMRCREHVITGAAKRLLESAPIGQRPSDLAAEASAGAVWGMVHRYVASGRAHLLPAISGVCSFVSLAPAVGAQCALDAIVTEQARFRSGSTSRVGGALGRGKGHPPPRR